MARCGGIRPFEACSDAGRPEDSAQTIHHVGVGRATVRSLSVACRVPEPVDSARGHEVITRRLIGRQQGRHGGASNGNAEESLARSFQNFTTLQAPRPSLLPGQFANFWLSCVRKRLKPCRWSNGNVPGDLPTRGPFTPVHWLEPQRLRLVATAVQGETWARRCGSTGLFRRPSHDSARPLDVTFDVRTVCTGLALPWHVLRRRVMALFDRTTVSRTRWSYSGSPDRYRTELRHLVPILSLLRRPSTGPFSTLALSTWAM